MTKSFWKSHLLKFLEENKQLGPDSYELKRKMKVAFWCDGGLKVIATKEELALNFKDPDMMLLSVLKNNAIRIYRVPYSRVVCFEIIHEIEDKTDYAKNRFNFN